MLSEWCVLLSNKLIFNRLIIKNPYINRSKEVILCVIPTYT